MKNKQMKNETPSGDIEKKIRKEKKWGNLQKRIYPNPREEFFRDGVAIEKKHP